MPSIQDSYPEYSSTSRLDTLRATEYAYLDQQHHIYLDYTGSSLASHTQLTTHASRLSSTVFGNPHSANPTSHASTSLIESARSRVLRYLNADPATYVAIFTPNATAAARLVGESYPFSRRSPLVLTQDNHNSINGLREFARRAGGKTKYIPPDADLRTSTQSIVTALAPRWTGCGLYPRRRGRRRGLFAYPAQSNFSGVRHPLSWIPMAQQLGYDVLLDAAAFLPTSALDLSDVQPDFVTVSWYKVFGYPTGVGCLVARRDALQRLRRPWFSGGTVGAVLAGRGVENWHLPCQGHAGWEDGTVNFLSIPDVEVGLDWVEGVGMGDISRRVACLTGWCVERLLQLEHGNGVPMVRLYGPREMKMRGGTVCFNLVDVEGKVVDERIVARESAARGISLRTGCFCNPGAAVAAFGCETGDLKKVVRRKPGSPEEAFRLCGMVNPAAVRVSFGLASNAADVEAFLEWVVATYKDRETSSEGLPAREGC